MIYLAAAVLYFVIFFGLAWALDVRVSQPSPPPTRFVNSGAMPRKMCRARR